jgi:hypothetical protein
MHKGNDEYGHKNGRSEAKGSRAERNSIFFFREPPNHRNTGVDVRCDETVALSCSRQLHCDVANRARPASNHKGHTMNEFAPNSSRWTARTASYHAFAYQGYQVLRQYMIRYAPNHRLTFHIDTTNLMSERLHVYEAVSVTCRP